jgi:hypothetical protein
MKPLLLLCLLVASSCQNGHIVKKAIFEDASLPDMNLKDTPSDTLNGFYIVAEYDREGILRKQFTCFDGARINDTVIYSGTDRFYVQRYPLSYTSAKTDCYSIKRVLSNKLLIVYWFNFLNKGGSTVVAIDSFSNIGFKRVFPINYQPTDWQGFLQNDVKHSPIEFQNSYVNYTFDRTDDSVTMIIKAHSTDRFGVNGYIGLPLKAPNIRNSLYWTTLLFQYRYPYGLDPFSLKYFK